MSHPVSCYAWNSLRSSTLPLLLLLLPAACLREWDGFSYVDIADPSKGEEGYPRLLVENRVYSSRVFRKLHLEVAWRQDGLQVLHGVMYPR
jgi:hypothetical protein